MTQEEKDLLLKDLSARLPYLTKVQIKNEITVLNSICDDDGFHFNFIGDDKEGVNIENIKPYLFPLSSMTEEQHKEFYDVICWETSVGFSIDESCNQYIFLEKIDWLNKNYFDYRNLIDKNLAIDCTNLNIY